MDTDCLPAVQRTHCLSFRKRRLYVMPMGELGFESVDARCAVVGAVGRSPSSQLVSGPLIGAGAMVSLR